VRSPGVVADPAAIERFKNELKLARRIIHKNVCRMYDLNEETGLPYITMEYVPGEDLRQGEKEKITKRHTQNQAAHELYLKGRYYFNRRYQGDMIKAVVFYEKAIKKDPNYALPCVGIGDVFHIFGLWSFLPPEICYANSKAALEKALEIDDTIGELYTSLAALIQYREGDAAKAEECFLRSIEPSLDYSYAHGWYGIWLAS
jgi:tetratricopeptide (TPR) repeat protein